MHSTGSPAAELATILARAFFRSLELERNAAIHCAGTPQEILDVSAPESPDHVVEPATRRAS